MTAVDAQNLTMRFGSRILWYDLSFTFSKGKMYALTGSSGSGKSTLLNCIAGFISPSTGRILLDGSFSPHERGLQRQTRAEHIGFLFQNYALVEDSTVADNLQIATRTSVFARKASRRQMSQALTRVDLDIPLKTSVAILSGGERQRLAVARLLLKPKPLILADEPTGALDRSNAARILKYMREFADAGSCVVLATHDPYAVEACDEAIKLMSPTGTRDE